MNIVEESFEYVSKLETFNSNIYIVFLNFARYYEYDRKLGTFSSYMKNIKSLYTAIYI